MVVVLLTLRAWVWLVPGAHPPEAEPASRLGVGGSGGGPGLGIQEA